MHLRQRGKKGTFQLRHRLPDGRWIERSLHTSDKKVASFLAAGELRKLLSEQRPTELRDFSLQDAIERYMADCEPRLRAEHYRKRKARLEVIQKALGIKSLRGLTVDNIASTLARLRQEERWVEKTSNHYRNDLLAFCNWCRNRGWLQSNPVERVPALKVPVNEIDYLRSDEIEACLAFFKGSWLLPGVLLGIFAGLRAGEIERLERTDIDLVAKEISVRNTPRGLTKSARFRVVPMSANLCELLKPYCRGKGLLLGGRKVCDAMRGMTRRHSMPARWNWLTFRHTFGTNHSLSGTPAAVLAEWMGHTDIRITMRYYVGKRRAYHPSIEAFQPTLTVKSTVKRSS